MAKQDSPNQNANESRAEGEQWESDPDSVLRADRDENPERSYEDEGADKTGGITNRPLSEEIGEQEALPERGTTRDPTGNPDATRPEGDYTEDNR